MKPLLITAHLERGLSVSDPWSPALESIIAALKLQEQIGWQEYATGQSANQFTHFDDLPIEKFMSGDDWWWCCSSPILDITHEIARGFFKKFNILESMMIDRKVKNIELTKGQFKNYSLSYKETKAKFIQWHCIGDKDEISRLLQKCTQIGAKRGKGMGYVTQWEITESGDENTAKFSRAVPANYAEKNGISGVKMWRGYRPNFNIESNQTLCIMPFFDNFQ